MRLIGLVTTVALMLALTSNVFADGPPSTTAQRPGPIQASVRSMRWLPGADRVSKGAQAPFAPSGSGPRGQMSRRQVSILFGILGGAVGGFFVADSVCHAAHRTGADECGLPGLVFGMPIGAAAGGIAIAWLTK
jgi:hypothetical protein